MLYLEQFQNNRVDCLKQYQRLHSSLDRNFSLCSNQYTDKFPQLARMKPSKIDYSRDQTLLFLAKKSSTETKTTNENQHQKNKNSIVNMNENSTRLYHQVSRNVNGLAKAKSKGNQFSTSFLLPMQSSMKSDRPTTVPIIFDEEIRQTRIQTHRTFRPLNPHLLNLADTFNNDLTDSSLFPFKSSTCENDNQFRQRSYTDTFLDSSMEKTRDETPDPPKIVPQTDQYKTNAFQHIANLGNWQHQSKPSSTEHDDLSEHATNRIYEYKIPFSEEYDQAISLQAHMPSVYNSSNEWNLKDFYRDVKTPMESGTNTKAVFEKCLKLSKLQANTIRWEQRRRHNMNIYNRLMKNSNYDSNLLNVTGNLTTNLADLRRELRCNECKRVTCLGNCAPGQEYNQYKRVIPFSPVPSTREQVRCKLGLRTQRSMIDLRPRSQQLIRAEPTNLNPVVVVPLFEEEVTNKRPQRRLAHGFLPGRSIRSQRRETSTFCSSHKISS